MTRSINLCIPSHGSQDGYKLRRVLQGGTPLTVSSAAGLEEIVRFLVSAGANVDATYKV